MEIWNYAVALEKHFITGIEPVIGRETVSFASMVRRTWGYARFWVNMSQLASWCRRTLTYPSDHVRHNYHPRYVWDFQCCVKRSTGTSQDKSKTSKKSNSNDNPIQHSSYHPTYIVTGITWTLNHFVSAWKSIQTRTRRWQALQAALEKASKLKAVGPTWTVRWQSWACHGLWFLCQHQSLRTNKAIGSATSGVWYFVLLQEVLLRAPYSHTS